MQNKIKMCFGGKFHDKPRLYVSKVCEGDRIPKENYRTMKDVSIGNYHFWCVDRETNNVIDNTPPTLPPDERRVKEDPLYIPWCEELQREQREYCINNLYTTSINDDTGLPLIKEDIEVWMKEIVEYNDYKEKKCFRNSYALWKSNPRRYHLVCGSFGWLLEDKPNYQIIGLDYGY